MSCYCHQAVQATIQPLAALAAPPPAPDPPVAGAALLGALSAWLGARALPAPAWAPDPAWLDQPLPAIPLTATAMATISALAQLKAQVQAGLGLDLTGPAGAGAFARLAVTAQARARALVEAGLDQGALIRLAATALAADQVAAAVALGLLPLAPERIALAATPGGIAIQAWQPWLRALGSLAPLIAAAQSFALDLSGDFLAALSAQLRGLRAIDLPALPRADMTVLARATAALSALAQLRASLGVDVLAAGMPTLRALVAARAGIALRSLAQAAGSTPERLCALVPAQVVARLPALPYCPTSLATPAVAQAAAAIDPAALARMDWTIPPAASLAAITAGLPVAAFAVSFQAATGLQPVRATPCGQACDAARLTAPA